MVNEVEDEFNNLIKLANGEKIIASYFCGIYGLRLKEINEFSINSLVVIRNIDELNNPGIKDTISISRSDNNEVVMGCVLEYKIELGTGGIVEYNKSYQSKNQFFEEFLNLLRYSIITATHSIYPPLKYTFIDLGIPLYEKHPILMDSDISANIILDNEAIKNVVFWLNTLNQNNRTYFELTLEKIKSAIYNRNNPISSMLDAFISWETMFSSKVSTVQSVLKSIEAMLKRGNHTLDYSYLKKLYALRSDIVHGNPRENKLLNGDEFNNNYGEINEQIIDISLRVFKELLLDVNLLSKSPKDRVISLLGPKKDKCDHCGIEKYIFN